ncbi:MAG: ABC transporter substrate-binding protein [Alphaproteobacteria bacterium]|nr:ABC transporter substrate-binding protein [Alphaproteobacteria bacterium]
MPSRRRMLALSAAVTLTSFELAGQRVWAGGRFPKPASALAEPPICHATVDHIAPQGAPRELKLTWNANAICTVGVPVADQRGLFAKHNLKVELINFGGSTDQLLEAIASGKADAGIGMALRWLKPLEQGFDVRITTATHGGCMRLLTDASSDITGITGLKGKTVGVTDLAAPDKNFFSIMAAKAGVDPVREIEWRAFPADLLPVALQRGDIHAFTQGDPLGWIARDRDNLRQIATNLDGEYAHRACCVLGIRGKLIQEDRVTAAALTQALIEAQDWVMANTDEAAAIFAPFAPKAKPEQLAAMLRSHTHNHHPAGAELTREVGLYIRDLKDISVIKPSTDPDRFAARVTADVLSV